MNINRKMAGILAVVFPVAVNLLYFVLPLRRNATDWTCHAFIHLAYILLAVSILYTGANQEQYRSRASVTVMIARYFFTELFIGAGMIIVNQLVPFSAWIAFVVQFLLFAVYFVITLVQLMANRHDETVDRIREEERHYIQACAEMVRIQMGRGTGLKANRAIEQVYDKLRTSPSRTVPAAKEIEMSIYTAVKNMKADLPEPELLEHASKILSMIDERNAILKISHS